LLIIYWTRTNQPPLVVQDTAPAQGSPSRRFLLAWGWEFLQFTMMTIYLSSRLVSSRLVSQQSELLDFACWAWPTLVPHSDYWTKLGGDSCAAHLSTILATSGGVAAAFFSILASCDPVSAVVTHPFGEVRSLIRNSRWEQGEELTRIDSLLISIRT
jgi:hypothetical protein